MYGPDGHLVRIIEQYSSSYTGEDEERIIKRVTTNDPTLRCIITTVALGMGVNMQGIQQVLHWGAPANVLQYWQELGRAGRGGEPASACLYAYGHSLIRITEGMKEVVYQQQKGENVSGKFC